MKKAIQLLGILTIFSLAAFAGRLGKDAKGAADVNGGLQAQISNYTNGGYTLVSETPNAFRYFVAPEGDFTWGTITYVLTKSAGEMSLETSYVTITATVQFIDRGKGGYKVTGFDITTSTVY